MNVFECYNEIDVLSLSARFCEFLRSSLRRAGRCSCGASRSPSRRRASTRIRSCCPPSVGCR